MAETVFILGAGASKEAGAPVMSEFVRTIEDLDESKIPEDLRPVRESLLQAARSMGDMVSRIAFMPTNIEDLLGVVEMAEMTGGLICRPGLNIDSLRGGLRRLIAHTLESSINFPVSGSGEMERHIEAPDSYAALDEWVKAVNGHDGLGSWRWAVSFNPADLEGLLAQQ